MSFFKEIAGEWKNVVPNCGFYAVPGRCGLSLYGGMPSEDECASCISSGQNNPEFAASLFASREATHPSGIPPVSGCCDSAVNPPQS